MLHLSPRWLIATLICFHLLTLENFGARVNRVHGQEPKAPALPPALSTSPAQSTSPGQAPAPDQTPAAATASKPYVDFVKDIVPLLEKHCLSCHQGDEPKGGFVVTDREAVLGYITPGSLSDSSLWTDYLTAPSKATQEDSLVMPPDGPMPMAQLALMKLWIEEGAAWPADFKFGDQAKTIQRGGSLPVRIYRAIGYFHPAIVHFPIALLSLAGMSVALSFFLGQRLIPFAYACLVIGAIGAVVSAVMGWSFADIRGLAEWSTMITSKATEKESNEFFHRWLGTATAVGAVVVAWMAYRARNIEGKRPGWGWKLGTLVLAMLVGIVGHQGGELVYGDIFAKAIELFSK
jgi:uncharacterized membrane protein